MTKGKFYRTKFVIEVLSEEPFGKPSLGALAYQVSEGPCVGSGLVKSSEKVLTGKQAAKALCEFGSEPGFFGLNDDGKGASQ